MTVKAASLDTTIKKRDKDLRAAIFERRSSSGDLRAAKFFDVEKYPDITAVVTGADAIAGDTVDLRADLTVKGATAPVPLHARARLIDDATVRLITETDINRKEFGVDGNVTGMIPAGATLTADVVFRRARA